METKTPEFDNVAKERDSPLYKFFTLQLQNIYWVEQYLVNSLPEIQKAATNEDLQKQLQGHILDTEHQVLRLEEIFSIMGIKAEAIKCETIEHLIKEVQTVIEETEPSSSTRDAAVIMVVQKVEHYEIATYGGLVQFATSMGFEKITNLLDQTLQEEKDADILLSDIADKKVNWLAEIEEKA